jgi:hypothetical protein
LLIKIDGTSRRGYKKYIEIIVGKLLNKRASGK